MKPISPAKVASSLHKPVLAAASAAGEVSFSPPPSPLAREEKKKPLLSGPTALLAMASPVPKSLTLGKPISRGAACLPPELDLTPRLRRKMRFYSTSAASTTITVNELIGALGGICTVTNSTIVHWTSSFKIIEIRLYPSVSTTTATNTVIEWAFGDASSNPDQCMSMLTPGGVVMAAPCLVFTPPPKCLAGDWINVNVASQNLFSLFSMPNASVLDLTVDSTLGVTFSSSALTSTVTTGILGQIYYLALDGASTNKIVPATGYPTTH